MSHSRASRFLRPVGWLLTPVVVWAASFLGGWVGALTAGLRQKGEAGLWWMVIGAVAGGLLGLVGWLLAMRWLLPVAPPAAGEHAATADAQPRQ